MSNKYERVERKAEEEFLDPRFTRLDDKFYTNFENPPTDEDWVDRRFSSGPTEVDNPLSREIVRFANEDADARRILAAAGVKDQSAKSAFRTRTKKGKWQGSAAWDESQRAWVFDVQREDGEVKTLFVHGHGPDEPDAAKIKAAAELSESDKTADLRVLGPTQVLLLQRLASQDPSAAFEKGLSLLFADYGEDGEYFDPYEVISREEHQEPLRQLTWYIFLGSPAANKLSEAETEKFREFATHFIGPRPWNLKLLKSALEAFRNKTVTENLQELDRKISQPEQISAADLDSMSEEEIDSTFDSVSREYIKSLKRNHR